MEKQFELALRKGYRFQLIAAQKNEVSGTITTEDLWRISLSQLNDLAKSLNKELKASEGEEDYINKKSVNTVDLQCKFSIVKHIIDVRLEEEEARKARLAKREKNAKIMDIIQRKEITDLEGKPLDELYKLLEEE